MTAPATHNPALASLVPAVAPATVPGAAAAHPGSPGAALPGAAPDTVFSALLLGLRAGAGGPAAAAPAADAATSPMPGSALPTRPTEPAGTPPDPSGGLPPGTETAATSDPPAGTGLPVDGTSQPPADLAALLATLGQPATPTGAPLPAAPPAAPATDESTPVTAPAQRVSQPVARARGPAAGPPIAAAREAAASDGAPPGTARGDDAAPLTGTDRSEPAPTPAQPAPGGLADVRARLAALLASAERPPLPIDAGAAPTGTTPVDPGAPAVAAAPVAAALPAASPAPDPLLDTLPALEPLGDADAWSRGVGERLLLMADRGLQSATIRLQPEHLGPVEIRVRVDEDGAARVHFSAQHAQTRDALEQAIPRLRELFADQGLSLSQANVDAGRGGFAQRPSGPEPPPWLRWAGAAEPEPEAGSSAWRIVRSGERRLDVLV